MLFSTLPDWLDFLQHQHSLMTGKAIDLGLDRVKSIAQSMALIEDGSGGIKRLATCQIVTVAGTNGKGSFIASCEALLLDQGLRVAAYTSPHILTFNERIRVNGDNVDDSSIMLAFQSIYEHCQLHDISLSYFEFTTLAGLYCFQQHALDVIFLEIGLGGRLDAVNIVEPDQAVITSIGLDHQDYLGHTLEAIAFEKAGILRQNTPLLLLDSQALPALIAAKQGRPSIVVDDDFSLAIGFAENGQRFWQMQEFSHNLIEIVGSSQLPKIADNGLSLPSQAGAVIIAQGLLKYFNMQPMQPQHIANTLTALSLAGRFQQFDVDGVRVIFDVAHNAQALDALKFRIQHRQLGSAGSAGDPAKRVAVFSMLNDKPIDYCIELFKDDFFAWFLAEVDDERAFKPSIIAEKLHNHGVHMISVSKNFTQAFARLRQMCQPGDEIIIFGSFVSVSALIKKVSRLGTVVNVSIDGK